MSEYGSTPPRDPRERGSGPPGQEGDQGPDGQGGPAPDQAQNGQDQYGQPPYGQGQPPYGQGQPPYGQGQPPYGQGQPQYGQNPYGQGQYGQPPEYGSPEQQGQYGQGQYGQGGYGQPGAYGSNPYGQPTYGSFGNQPYGSPTGGGNGIPPNIEIATMGRRLGAFVIDVLIMSVVVVLLAVLLLGLPAMASDTNDPDNNVMFSTAYLAFLALTFVFSLAYQIALVALRGATPGKMILGMRIVRTEDGQVPGWIPAILRWLIPFIGSFVCGIGQIVVYLSPFFDSSGRRQGWHDMAAKTVVIRV